MIRHLLEKSFKDIYGNDLKNTHFYFAPGRVNLIGEHIDYNGGHVFPYAISNGTYMIAKKREDNFVRYYSLNLKKNPNVYEALVTDEKIEERYKWVNYPKCVITMMRKYGYNISSGFDIIYYGNIPGSGLSSSASIEVVMAIMLDEMFNLNIEKKELVKICQGVENVCYGLKTGIMDQFAVTFGKKDHAIFLDCATLDYEYAPFNLKEYKVVVTNSNVPHSLASSKYNERRNQCEEALADLQKQIKINHLCDLSPKEFEAYKNCIKDDICRKRAKFAIEEEERTKAALKVLKENNIIEFAKYLNGSGDGLRYDYEATCKEIDFLVDESRKADGCIGARITGGGWGGNIIALIKTDKVDKYIEDISNIYLRKFGIFTKPKVLECAQGARNIDNDMF